MTRSSHAALQRQVAASVDAPPALLPVFTELFAGLEALGSAPAAVVRELRRAGVRRNHRLLDLACGKGAISIAAAKAIGCRVVAIDGCEAFIESARLSARRHGVLSLCCFRAGDVHRPPASRFDAALMIGLLPLPEAARLLRRCVRSGGIYIIDDCWWDQRLAEPDHPACFTKAQSIDIIKEIGDTVERVTTPGPAAVRALNDRLYARLKANAAALAREHPRHRAALREFLRRQRAANDLLGDVLRPALWIVRRS